MIKWLKKLVKGSDFVVAKKKISVIALDPRAGKSYGEDIAGLFSDVADISVFSMLDGSAAGVLERADLFVASTDAYGSPEELAKHIPLDSQTMAIEVSFRWSELRKLKELPAGSKVLFVNMTETMAREAIAQLEQFGITHIHWIPFYPGASLEEDIHIAVTPDEMRYVPPKMETVIDIGQRVCTSGMMIEIALRLGLESYGDIVGPASECGGVFAELDLPHVQYTYDPGNTYRFCRGEIRLDEDLQNASVPVAYLHMKDGSIHDGYIWNEPIGQGVFPYPVMFAALERQGGTLACALEMPMSFCVSMEDLSFRFLEPSDEQIYAQIMQSVEYIRTIANIQ